MIRRQDGLLALLVEAEDAERGDQGRGAAAGQADPLAPAGAVAVAGRGAVADALDEAVPRLRHDDDDAPGEAGDVRAPAAPRQLDARLARVTQAGRNRETAPMNFSNPIIADPGYPLDKLK